MNFPFPLGLSKHEWLLNIYIYLFPPGFQQTFIKIVALLTKKAEFVNSFRVPQNRTAK